MDMKRKNYFGEADSLKIIRDLRQKPSLLEKEYQALCKKLKKNNIQLDLIGEVDFSKCKDEKIVKEMKKNIDDVKLALYYQDQQFNYIHR